MNAKIDGIEYIIPDSLVSKAKRMFKGKRAMANGLHVDEIRLFLKDRIVPWDGVKKPVALAYADYRRGSDGLRMPVPYSASRNVALALGTRLVQQWVREVYLVNVRRGVYKLAAKPRAKR